MKLAFPVGFGVLNSLHSFVEGMDRFMNADGTDIVAVPYDEINQLPETTFRELNSFRWWATPSYGPECEPLSPETRKRHGQELKSHFNKKFVGDMGQIVDINEDFKRKRFREIEDIHEVAINIREKSDGNRFPSKYLKHTNNGGSSIGTPIPAELLRNRPKHGTRTVGVSIS